MQIREDILLDYLAGELSPEEQHEVKEALASSEALRGQLDSLKRLSNGIKALPLEIPSDKLRLAVNELLVAEEKGKTGRLSVSYLRIAIAASILLLAGIWIGVQWTNGNFTEDNLQKEVFLLMQEQKSSVRMKAVSMSMELAVVNVELLDELTHLLLEDESVGVRLAALDALLLLEETSSLEETLITALKKEQKPVIQIALIQALVELNTEEAVPLFQDLIQADSTFQKVRDEAYIGTFKLI